jgi:hypothetical protein
MGRVLFKSKAAFGSMATITDHFESSRPDLRRFTGNPMSDSG